MWGCRPEAGVSVNWNLQGARRFKGDMEPQVVWEVPVEKTRAGWVPARLSLERDLAQPSSAQSSLSFV